MPDRFRYIVIAFGTLFFLGHVGWMLFSLTHAVDRSTRLEYAGKVVPGFAGLCVVGATITTSPLLAIALYVAALPVMIVGRAVYEQVVFSRNRRS
ncbi:MAG: hypothetical protein O2820_13050 [Planctomycetota bacterium]|nr:hypothetical protein [Planctomycetota bacterium]MDA1250140.1 hypothetical protein [Planctomycetota bacterium]